MTPINNAEQVLLLLRSHLQRTQRSRRKDAAPGSVGRKQTRRGPLDKVQQVASADGLSEADVTRALISGLLEEEFGAVIANDPKFQHMVDDVRQIIDRDETARRLLRQAVAQLSAGES